MGIIFKKIENILATSIDPFLTIIPKALFLSFIKKADC